MKTLIGLLPFVLHGSVASALFGLSQLPGGATVARLLLPTYPILVALVAGLTARCVSQHIRTGRFDRDPGTPLYRGRMIYGAAWTSLYYFKPVLHVLLLCPPLKTMVFRLFGYRGSMDFTIYPDSWIRDLRLLEFGAGTYVSNRATLGTNQVRSDGKIQVGSIKTGRNVIIGHLSMVGGGTRIGDGSEVGIAAKVGFLVRLGDRVSIGPDTVVDSGSRLMDDVRIGPKAYIGKASVIHAGVRIPAGTVLPDRSVIRTEADLEGLRPTQRDAA